MKAVVTGGGLRGDWDRMVVIFPGTTIADLNANAGTTQVCWENLPRSYIDDVPLRAYYLFLKSGEPLQAVSWFYPNDHELNFRSSKTMAVYPDTMMTPVNGPGVDPYLILTAE